MTTFTDQTSEDGFHLLLTWSDGIFSLRVTSPAGEVKTDQFRQNFEPRFGMDVVDCAIANKMAERLAVELGATPYGET